jgi:hypothetical protein
MSATFLEAVKCRAADETKSRYSALADRMPPLVHSLLFDNRDPAEVDAGELLEALRQDNSAHDWASRLNDALRTVDATLNAAQCTTLRNAIDSSAATSMLIDSVDGLLEHQLNLTHEDFQALLGKEAVDRLHTLAVKSHAEFTLAGPMADAAAASAAREAGVRPPLLPDAPHEIFIRRYCPETRPWFGFHTDRSSLTLNIALSDDAAHAGGRLVAILHGKVHVCQRREGTATLHSSTLLHAVTRMLSGVRYSLIVFYRQICPHANHHLVRCSPSTLAILYPVAAGSYSCDMCNRSAEAMDYPGMWHCGAGCEYDVCSDCHRTYWQYA